MKRASSQGSINLKTISPKSKQKIRKTIKSALGRQKDIKKLEMHEQNSSNRNLRSYSTKSLIGSRKSVKNDKSNKYNFYNKMDQNKIKHRFFDEKASIGNSDLTSQLSIDRHTYTNQKTKNRMNLQISQKNRQNQINLINKPQKQTRIISSYQWWHNSGLEIQTQQRIRANKIHKQYLTYFAYPQPGTHGKKNIIAAFENHTMYPGDTGLIIFGITKSLQVQLVNYSPKIQIKNNRYSFYLICAPNKQGQSFINKQIIIESIIKQIDRKLMDRLIKLKIQENYGSVFYLLIKLASESIRVPQKNSHTKETDKKQNKKMMEISKQALMKFNKYKKH